MRPDFVRGALGKTASGKFRPVEIRLRTNESNACQEDVETTATTTTMTTTATTIRFLLAVIAHDGRKTVGM